MKEAIQELRRLREEEGRRRRTERLGAWYASLSRGVKAFVTVVIAAGAVATAIGAILALWPDPAPPVVELRAELTELSVDENVTLSEYEERHKELDGSSAPGPRELSSYSAAQPTPTSTTPAETTHTETTTTTTETTETSTTATQSTETETTETQTGTTQTETEPTDPDDLGDDIIVVPSLNEVAEVRLGAVLREKFERPSSVPQPQLAEVCITGLHKPECGLSSTVAFMHVADDTDPEEIAEDLEELLSNTQTDGNEPLGVTVYYRISVTGFRDRNVDVRWELHRPNGPKLPFAWLRNQRAALFKGEAERDSASPHFWIPLPEGIGPFFVRLTALDEDGVPLAHARTPTFG